MSQRVALITGSTRTPRVGPEIAGWVSSVLQEQLKSSSNSNVEIVPLDIADFKLPVFDETVVPAGIPAAGQFQHEHSKRWSEAIASFNGYIFVIPEYNGGMAGGTKNAIDYLYSEWPGKPVIIVSYGINGGNMANDQLKFSLGVIQKMKVMEPTIRLPFKDGSQGPDFMSAMSQGKLGDESKKNWAENGRKDEILKAWGSLVELLAAGGDPRN